MRVAPKARCALLIWSAVGACQFREPAAVPLDAPPADAPTDARSDVVHGRSHTAYATEGSTVERYPDLSRRQIRAHVADKNAPTGFRVIDGRGNADGTFQIEGIPAGQPFLLQTETVYYATSAHDLLLQRVVPTSPDIPRLAQPTPVILSASNLLSPHPGDELYILSLDADFESGAWVLEGPGATFASSPIEWGSITLSYYDDNPLPHGWSPEHRVLVAQRLKSAEAGVRAAADQIVAVGVVSASLVEGAMNTVSVDMAAPMGSFTLPASVNVSRSALDFGHSLATQAGALTLSCAALPVSDLLWTYREIPMGPVIVRRSRETWAPNEQFTDLSGTFADPMPPGWPRYCQRRYTRPRWLKAVGLRPSNATSADTVWIAPPSDFSGNAILSPPSNIRVGGHSEDEGGALPGSASTIRIEWQGNARATQYAVYILRVRSTAGFTNTVPSAVVHTRETAVDLPLETFAGLESFAVRVVAYAVLNDFGQGVLLPAGMPGQAASSVTTVYRWLPSCGNGVTDAAEECDDGPTGSATCDADCTLATCGDGTRNALAGEACDAIVDTLGCDSDCTPTVCGDGHLNRETEQCDDGGRVPGDGCSADCRIE